MLRKRLLYAGLGTALAICLGIYLWHRNKGDTSGRCRVSTGVNAPKEEDYTAQDTALIHEFYDAYVAIYAHPDNHKEKLERLYRQYHTASSLIEGLMEAKWEQTAETGERGPGTLDMQFLGVDKAATNWYMVRIRDESIDPGIATALRMVTDKQGHRKIAFRANISQGQVPTDKRLLRQIRKMKNEYSDGMPFVADIMQAIASTLSTIDLQAEQKLNHLLSRYFTKEVAQQMMSGDYNMPMWTMVDLAMNFSNRRYLPKIRKGEEPHAYILSLNTPYHMEEKFTITLLHSGKTFRVSHIEAVREHGTENYGNNIEYKDGGDICFTILDEMPKFVGGQDSMMQYLRSHTQYPKQAQAKSIEGKVLVKFMVESDGSISNVKVVRSAHPLLDKEAVRVVAGMPRWMPGRDKGKAQRIWMTLPLTFKLQ